MSAFVVAASLMSNSIWLIVPVAAVLIIAFIVVRRRAKPEGGEPKYDDSTEVFVPPVMSNTPAKRRRVYHGAVMEPGFDACAAAECLRGKRYRPADAPTLPLPACNHSKCECLMRPTRDRRSSGARRGEDMAIYANENDIIASVRTEHRIRTDRREG